MSGFWYTVDVETVNGERWPKAEGKAFSVAVFTDTQALLVVSEPLMDFVAFHGEDGADGAPSTFGKVTAAGRKMGESSDWKPSPFARVRGQG